MCNITPSETRFVVSVQSECRFTRMPRPSRSTIRPQPSSVTSSEGFDISMSLSMGMKASELRDLLPNFDPEWENSLEARQWIETVNKVCDKYHIPEEIKLLQASLKLKGSAKLWYQGCQNDISTWGEFVLTLEETFPTVIDRSEYIDKISKRRQGPRETATSYYFEQVSLAKKIQLDDATTINYIIKGVRNAHQRIILASKKHSSLSALLEMMKRMEKVEPKENSRSLRKNSSSLQEDHDRYVTSTDGQRKYHRSRSPLNRDGRSRSNSPDTSPQRDLPTRNNDRQKTKSGQNMETKKSTTGTNKSETPGASTRLCFLCKSPDHLLRQCPWQKEYNTSSSTSDAQ